ncbi:hypothetical protein tloyanaT_21840 [Thalassotalea loyana]|uniref:Lipoprotein n=1 Tax=Thalassotalea loyana TaxID=280483 RepID=A0ABQ6HCU6_9GAMM|nr:hypothetical protein [Thalassotalea loyana]GLX85932.1 hypothetical protein tloyanaT_21840 [Thalassotalea loyana]
MNKILSLFSFGFLSCSVQCGTWVNNVKIEALYPTTAGLVFIVDAPNLSLSNCDGGRRYIIPMSHPNYDVLSSSLLLAFSMDKDTNINVDDVESPICQPTINRIYVKKRR